MDQVFRRILQFDHFALDLTRGCMRIGDCNVDLPPKPFEVMQVLAENAGRLVTKDELCSSVWPDVTVGDDSLVQCIRLLRQKLGDHDYQLIKTVPRRGYLLNATPLSAALPHEATASPTAIPPEDGGGRQPSGGLHAILAPRKRAAFAALLLLNVAFLSAVLLSTFVQPSQKAESPTESALLPRSPPLPSELFTLADASRVRDLAARKELPLPPFVVQRLAVGVSERYRRFVGIWVSDRGWPGSGRQLMLIVARVDAAGTAEGYVVDGPPQPESRDHAGPRFSPFVGRISGDAIYFGSLAGERVVSLMPDRKIEFKRTWRDGGSSSVMLDPEWTLLEREREA